MNAATGASRPQATRRRVTLGLGTKARTQLSEVWSRGLTAVLTLFFVGWQIYLAGLIDGLGVPLPRLNWDGEWYLRIAEEWYPAGGAPGRPPPGFDAYAFHPLYPLLVRAAGSLPGASPEAVAPWVNLVLAVAAVALLASWTTRRLGRAAAVTTVVALTVWPSSGAFQLAYTEGLALLLLVLVWRWVDEGRHGPAAVAIVLLSLARPLAIPLAVAIAAVAGLEWWRTRDLARLRGPAAVVVAAAVATLAWPMYAAVHSGDPGVYLAAHNAFAKPGAPTSPLTWGLEEPVIGVLVLLVLVMTTVIGTKLLPTDTPALVRAWVVVYPVYLVVGSLVTSSFLRYFMLAFPAALLFVPVVRRRAGGALFLAVAVALGILGARWWIPEMVPFVPDGTYP